MKNLSSLFGFKDGDGITCPGGSFSNMLALLTARNLKFPSIKKDGNRSRDSPLVVFTSDQAHYSIKKSCMVLGMGTASLEIVPSDVEGAMRVDLLRTAIQEAKDQGKTPFFVNATAGTTVRGAYDSFSDISEVCREFDCWFHIDACWGGSAIFSSKHKHLMSGCETADSIAWNAHKMLGVPIQTSILLMKDNQALRRANSLDDITYLFHDDDYCYDLGKKTFMCGRRGDVLKLYISWLYYGSDEFERWVDKAFDNAAYLSQLIDQENDFEMLYGVQSVNVCFNYVPEHVKSSREQISELNKKIEEQMTREGEIFIDSNSSQDTGMYFRVVFHSPLTSHAHIDHLLSSIRKTGEKLASNSE